MKHLLSLLLSIAFVAGISGCSEVRIETVRSGTLDFDETKTIGDVLDNPALISNGRWKSFDAEDGSHVVEFTGKIQGLGEEMATLGEEFQKNPAALTLGALAGGGEMGAIGLGMLLNSGMEIQSCDYTIQFLMSKRDLERFEIGASSFTAKVKMPDGKVIEETFSDEDGDILESLYDGNKSAIGMVVLSRFLISGVFQQIFQQINQ